MVALIDQPTTRRENKSSTAATYSQPSAVQMYVKSAIHLAAMIAYRPWRPIWFTRRWRVLISTGGEPAIRAAMKSTTTIPIVFILGGDPVERACRQFNPPAAT